MNRFLQLVCGSGLGAGLVLGAACSGTDEFQLPQERSRPGENSGPVYDASTATASVSGRVRFDGTLPEPEYLDMGGDFYCQRTGIGLLSEEVVVSDQGDLANVIVYVRSGHDTSLSYSPPPTQAVLDQDRCVYTPRVLTLTTGQELLIRNSDATTHNVHAETGQNTLFNFGQARAPREDTEVFGEPAMPVHVGCDLHKWMHTYLGIFDHPFHTTTGKAGTFDLRLPPGSYEIVAWHERYGEQVASVDLTDGQGSEIEFTFTD